MTILVKSPKRGVSYDSDFEEDTNIQDKSELSQMSKSKVDFKKNMKMAKQYLATKKKKRQDHFIINNPVLSQGNSTDKRYKKMTTIEERILARTKKKIINKLNAYQAAILI